ncbi:hypothetical protein D3C74_474350 [compost metagenome]
MSLLKFLGDSHEDMNVPILGHFFNFTVFLSKECSMSISSFKNEIRYVKGEHSNVKG